LKRSLKSIFLTGLAVVMPLGLTIYIFIFLIEIMDSLLLIVPDRYQPDVFLPFHVPGLGAIVTVALILFCGLIAKSYFGNKVVKMGEGFLDKIPFIRSIYQAIKQIADTMFADRSASFKNVVLFHFPSKTTYSVGFVTGVIEGEITAKIGQNNHYVSVFMPTAPNPTTGLYMIMPEDELIYLDMSVEEAFTLIISAGIVTPTQRTAQIQEILR
jgi:uncharacterized membrane protein